MCALTPLLLAPFLSIAVQGEAPARPSAEATWPQWRGPTRDAHVRGPEWPSELSKERLVEVWRVADLGPSYSGPVCNAVRVITTETVDEEHEVVRAFSRATGEELWRASWEGAMEVPFFAARNGSWIRSTPALDETAVYVAGMRDVLKCLDLETGEERWSVDFTERHGTELPPFGLVCSPLVTAEHVYVQAADSVVKLDKATGKTVWRALVAGGDMMSAGAFSSPVLATLGGREQLVAQSRTELAGIDLADGKTLWATPVRTFRGMNILTPTIHGDAVFTAAYGGRAHLFEVLGDDDGLAVEEAWNAPVQGYMSSPVVVDGHAYVFTRGNRLACIELATGDELWTSPPTGDDYWSLAVQGERILALSQSGVLRLLRANPEDYEVLSERELVDGETWAHLAPAGEQLLVRAQDALVAFAWKTARSE